MNTLSKRQFLKLSLASGVALSLSACGGGDDHDIVDVLSDYPEYSLLVEAVKAAGLVETLKGRGPFTVFAPNNAAFGDLLTDLGTSAEDLFANKGLLTTVLTYHVLGSRVPAADIPFGSDITTVQKGTFRIANTAGGPVITDGRGRTSNIKVTNLYASNGVIHGIDKVILPANKDITVADVAALTPGFSILAKALLEAKLVTTLQGEGPFTVFAPTNAAFESLSLSAATVGSVANLDQILTYHVVPGKVFAAQVAGLLGNPISTVQGDTFTINSVGGRLLITDGQGNSDSEIVATDVEALNGVIHVISKVIFPGTGPV